MIKKLTSLSVLAILVFVLRSDAAPPEVVPGMTSQDIDALVLRTIDVGKTAYEWNRTHFAAYAGTYTDPWRGDVTIDESGGRLTLTFSRTEGLVGDLEHYAHDTFLARWRDRSLNADAYVRFTLGFQARSKA